MKMLIPLLGPFWVQIIGRPPWGSLEFLDGPPPGSLCIQQDVRKFVFSLSPDKPIGELIQQWSVFVRKPGEYLTIPDILLRTFLSRADLKIVMNIDPLLVTNVDEMLSELLPDDVVAEWLCRPKEAVWNVRQHL